MKKTEREKPLLVATEHKGIYFGWGVPSEPQSANLILRQAQLCVYWSSDVKGVLGLAVTGPTAGCKVGPSVPVLHLRDVTYTVECTVEAVEAWAKRPWA